MFSLRDNFFTRLSVTTKYTISLMRLKMIIFRWRFFADWNIILYTCTRVANIHNFIWLRIFKINIFVCCRVPFVVGFTHNAIRCCYCRHSNPLHTHIQQRKYTNVQYEVIVVVEYYFVLHDIILVLFFLALKKK